MTSRTKQKFTYVRPTVRSRAANDARPWTTGYESPGKIEETAFEVSSRGWSVASAVFYDVTINTGICLHCLSPQGTVEMFT